MTEQEFKEILHKEETDTVEFKSWVNARNMKEIISLAVDELIAFANSKGGTVYFGVEDNPVVVTGCDRNYDGQRIIEGIYDRTIPPLFTEISDFEYEGKLVANLFICLQPLHIHIIKHWDMIIHIIIYYYIFFTCIITIQSSCILFNYPTE